MSSVGSVWNAPRGLQKSCVGNSSSGLGKRNYWGEMGYVDKFLVQKTNEVYQNQFPEQFELDEYFEKAFPTLSTSLKGVVSQNFQGALAPDSLVMHSFQVN